MLWYVGMQNKIKKDADILGTHIVSALTFNDSKVHVQNNSLSIQIDSGIMEVTCGCHNSTVDNSSDASIPVFMAAFSNLMSKCRVKLSSSKGAATAGIKIGLEEVQPPRLYFNSQIK